MFLTRIHLEHIQNIDTHKCVSTTIVQHVERRKYFVQSFFSHNAQIQTKSTPKTLLERYAKNNPHDLLTKTILSDVEIARFYLPQSTSKEKLDWSKLTIEDVPMIDEHLDPTRSLISSSFARTRGRFCVFLSSS